LRFLLRDDDTCGMTRAEQLQRCYADIWDYIPVCLSVTPFIIPSGAAWNPKEFVEGIPVALGDHEEIVAFLRAGLKEKRLDVALHGYHHLVTTRNHRISGYNETELFHKGREYFYGDRLEEKTREGKHYLERLLEYKVNTFVPPGNMISREGLSAIIRCQLNLVGSPGLGAGFTENRPFDPLSFMNAVKRKMWKIRHRDHERYPFGYRFSGGHKEIDYYTLYPSADINDLKRQIDFIHEVNGVFVLGVHYHAFSSRLKSGKTVEYALHSLLDHLTQKDNVEYFSYRELWESVIN